MQGLPAHVWVLLSFTCLASSATIPVSPGGLAAALEGAAAGDTLSLADGVYEECGHTISHSNLSIIGAGPQTIIQCQARAFNVLASGTLFSKLRITHVGSESEAGLLSITGSRASFTDCSISNGLSTASGAGITIFGKYPPFAYTFTDVLFENNVIVAQRSQSGANGAVGAALQIQLIGNSTASSTLQFARSRFVANRIVMDNGDGTTGGSITGAGINIWLQQADFSVSLKVESSSFTNNSLLNTAPTHTASGANPDMVSVAGGVAVALQTAVVGSGGTTSASAASVEFTLRDNEFRGNHAQTENCNGLSATANGGAIAVLGQATVDISGGLFSDNFCNCVAGSGTDSGGISEGGAIFIQSPAPSHLESPSQAATITSTGVQFLRNSAVCAGTTCKALGGALALNPVLIASFHAAQGTSNTAKCQGNGCSAFGGWCGVVNGPGLKGLADIGCYDTVIKVDDSVLDSNSAIATPAPVGSEYLSCDPKIPVCLSSMEPIMGGALAVQTENGCNSTLEIDVADTTFRSNTVANSMSSVDGQAAFGSAYGTNQFLNAGTIKSTFTSSQFSCNDAVCVVSSETSDVNRALCSSLQNMSIAGGFQAYGSTGGQTLAFGGAGCSFAGPAHIPATSNVFNPLDHSTKALPPITVSPECSTSRQTCLTPTGTKARLTLTTTATFSTLLTTAQEAMAKSTFKSQLESHYSSLSITFTVTMTLASRRESSYTMSGTGITTNSAAAPVVSTTSLVTSLDSALQTALSSGITVTVSSFTVTTTPISGGSTPVQKHDSSSGGLTHGDVIGVIIGCAAALVLVGGIIYYFVNKRYRFVSKMTHSNESTQEATLDGGSYTRMTNDGIDHDQLL